MRSRMFIRMPRPRAQHPLAIRNKLKCGHFVRDSGRIDFMCRPNIYNLHIQRTNCDPSVSLYDVHMICHMHLLCAGFDGPPKCSWLIRRSFNITYLAFSGQTSAICRTTEYFILFRVCFRFRCYKFAQSTFFGILNEICCCVFLHFICSSRYRTLKFIVQLCALARKNI